METDTTPPPDDAPRLVLRAPDGRFLPGSASPSPGRPRRETEEVYLRTLSERVSLDDWAQVIDKALVQAKSGDSRARNFLATWLLPERIDLTRFLTEPQAHAFVQSVLQIVVARVDLETLAILRQELSRQLEANGLA